MGAAGALSHITVWTRWPLVPCNPYGMSGIVHSVCDNRARFMKRKIAAIMAADIAGYSKLVAEDEEETLRRLASYRGVFSDFVPRLSRQIFNTPSDAIPPHSPSP